MKQRTKQIISRCLVGIAISSMAANKASAQIHTPNLPDHKWLVTAEEQFQQAHYSVASQSAARYLSYKVPTINRQQIEDADKANYYVVASSLKLDGENCVDDAIAYIDKTPNPAYKQRVAYHLAQYYFQHQQLNEAIPYYEMAGIANLSNQEIANAKFELAYCYFNNREFDKATPLFSAIRSASGEYTAAGNYYFGLLAYNQGNFEEALASFKKIENEKQYKSIVPYYVAEIYYFTGKSDKALEEALQLIRRPEKSFYDNELHLLAAQVLFEDHRYGDALPYFEHYYETADKIRKEDMYEMGYSYYRVDEWKNAIDKFKPLSNTQDSLGQTAMYLLGDCYLKINDKKSARNAFGICADMSFNPGQQEASLLLASKLSYEMGYYNDAVGYVRNLLASYPQTQYKDEAKTLLSDLLIKTGNYADAYQQMMEVSRRDEGFGRVYQKVTYGYAIQHMRESDWAEAIKLLNSSLAYPVNDVYAAAANFWMGDIAYRVGNYGDVIDYNSRFLQGEANRTALRQLSPQATLENANLNMGYAAMQLQNYGAAQAYFSKAQQSKGLDENFKMNAILREADAVMMQKEYSKAANLYDKVISANGADVDYARYQKAILLGLQNRNNDKAALLQILVNANPPSKYANDARYELALLYIEDDKYSAAINMLQPLTQGNDKRDLASKAWMKTGFAYQQMNDAPKAIDAYKRVVTGYPSSDERAAALDALKSLYIQNNQPDAYANLLKENNISSEDEGSLDSAYYAAAEQQFSSGKWDKSKEAMSKYLQQYPNGAFVTKANYYKAESHYKLKEYKEALAGYDAVLSAPWSDFTENASRKAATLAYQNKDYNAALGYYEKLRNNAIAKENLQLAYTGMMQSSYELGKYEAATAYADTLNDLPGLDDQARNSMLLYKARSLQQYKRREQALTVYLQLANQTANNEIATEARYRIAEIYLQQNKLKEAEDAANASIKKAAGNDYWIVKSYLLISDVLVSQKDYFNAKATLQSIVKNTKNEELKKEATAKLEEVKTLEKQQSKLSE
ncbi:MAG: tetratricopeptide repeat protein [Sphingobacteriales bacterium]|nr:MAG: tetratricopeptide repeat protein [Sphingobacteriales bacterium]